MSTDNNFFNYNGVKVAKGDTVEIVLRGVVDWLRSDNVLSLDRHHVLNPMHGSFVSMRVIPKPIKVGDAVRTKSISAQRPHLDRGMVMAIDNCCQQAWVKPIAYGLAQNISGPAKNETFNLSELEVFP